MGQRTWYVYGNSDKVVLAVKNNSSGKADEIATDYYKRKFHKKTSGGYTYIKPHDVRVIHVPKRWKTKPHKEDFIDRLIAYESDEGMTQAQNEKFLKEVEKKGLGSKLQGHYGRSIAEMHQRKRMKEVS